MIGLVSFVTGCGGKTTPNQPKAFPTVVETPEEVARQDRLVDLTLSPEEQAVRARAAEIKREKELEDAKKLVRAHDTPEMKQARKELEEEREFEQKMHRERERIAARAGVSGCQEGTVQVNPGALEFTTFTDSVTVRITNSSSSSRDISTSFRGLGVVVRNLCAGGSVSIAFARHVFNSPQYETIVLTAAGMGERGGVVVENYQAQLYSSYGTNGVRRDNFAWTLYAR